MSSAHSNFAERFATALKQINRAESGGVPELHDTDRLAALIEAAKATFDVNDPRAVEAVFAMQGVALDVIFNDFIRRKYYTFDNMRVALRAQAQCRATFKSLNEYKNPRIRPSAAPARNSSEQTVESANTPNGANA